MAQWGDIITTAWSRFRVTIIGARSRQTSSIAKAKAGLMWAIGLTLAAEDMSKFVNFNKRSVSLPRGCKNLIDMLQPPSQQKYPEINQHIIQRVERLMVTRDETFAGPISEVAKHVNMGFESHALMFMLTVRLQDDDLKVDTVWMHGEPTQAFVFVDLGGGKVADVRVFLKSRGVPVPEEAPTPPTFDPNLPVISIYDISSMASDPSGLAALIADLFRSACGLEDLSQLYFHYEELSDAG